MGFLSSLTGALVKTVITPIAVVKDVVNVATGEDPTSTKELVESIVDDLEEAGDSIG